MMGRPRAGRKMESQVQKWSVRRGSDLNIHDCGDKEAKLGLCVSGKPYRSSGFTGVLRSDGGQDGEEHLAPPDPATCRRSGPQRES